MTLGGKRVLGFAEDGYEDLELWVPVYRPLEEDRQTRMLTILWAPSNSSKSLIGLRDLGRVRGLVV